MKEITRLKKDLSILIKELEEMTEAYKKGYNYYLGDPIIQVIRDQKRWINQIEMQIINLQKK